MPLNLADLKQTLKQQQQTAQAADIATADINQQQQTAQTADTVTADQQQTSTADSTASDTATHKMY